MLRSALSILLPSLLATAATAAEVSVNIPVSGTTPTTGFVATIDLVGTATVSGSGRARIPLAGIQNFSISPQTVPLAIQGGAINVQRNAQGMIQLNYETQDPPAPLLVEGADVNLLGGVPVPVTMTPVTIEIDTELLGLIPLSLDMGINISGAVSGMDFVSSGVSSSPGSFYNVPGEFLLDFNLGATGTLDLGILGNTNLGTLFNETVNDQPVDNVSLPGLAGLTNLGGGSGPTLDDLGTQFFLPDLGIALETPFDESGMINQDFPDPGFFGGPAITDLDINWGVELTVSLSNISYDLSGVVADGVDVPEPSTALLAGLACAAIVCMARRRR